MLALVAGFLFAVLPLLLARWITPWFSGSATVWVQTLAVAVGSGGIGLIFGRWIQEKMAGNAARWLPILGLLGAIFSLPANPGPEWMIPAPSDATIALLELLLAKCLPVTMALGVVVGTQLAPTDAAIVGRSTAVGAIAGAFLFLLLDNLFTNARLAVGFSWGMLIFALLFAVLRLRVPLSKPGRRGSGDEFETGARLLVLQLALTGIATAMLFV
ncbi:MAG TPA: hypothetical protein DCY13_25175, partial [Verrucomicrobiales bacterium]|nr:hypothetical protein [Verrucomicrobiales bacterium]